MSKPKRAKLTKKEIKLLENGGCTKETWICPKCEVPISGRDTKCFFDGTAKPKKPKLLWPEYVVACEKVGLDPEEKIKYKVYQNAQGRTSYPIIFDKYIGKWVSYTQEETDGIS